MEKAVLKTLIYADIFDFPLKAWEIHKWLIGKKCDLVDVEKALSRLIKKKKVVYKNDLFVLTGREKLNYKRKKGSEFIQKNLKKVQLIVNSIKLIPWVKMVGICGDWSMKKVSKNDVVKLLVVTEENKLGTSKRIIETVLNGMEKVCLGKIVEKTNIEYEEKNLYSAHAALQMQLIWQKDKTYTKYLIDNSWAFKFLPNWTTSD
ncbi:MAG: hypothetical protein Q7R49_01135 [Candidatus Daviesbacteria bacterium]|nr:hypothetical protein [Candidatus Daviesbacteria bacterium]